MQFRATTRPGAGIRPSPLPFPRAAARVLCLLALALLSGPHAAADGRRPQAPVPGAASVGRLVMAGRAMCTGALVAPDLVLTAAHCLHDPGTGRRVAAAEIAFQAGLPDGGAGIVRKVASARQHPRYAFHRKGRTQLGYDLALLQLQSPIPASAMRPLVLEPGPTRGESFAVLAYSLGNRKRPALNYPCTVLARQGATLVMSCDVAPGASGAPVLALRGNGQPALVSVVSARAAMNGRRVSVGTVLTAGTLALLQGGG